MCEQCLAKNSAWQKQYRATNPEYRKKQIAAGRKWFLGAYWPDDRLNAVDRYEAMLVERGGACWICKQPETERDGRLGVTRRLAVDADHTQNPPKVRGLLCRKHNQAIGLFRHDPALLLRALDYLAKPPILTMEPGCRVWPMADAARLAPIVTALIGGRPLLCLV